MGRRFSCQGIAIMANFHLGGFWWHFAILSMHMGYIDSKKALFIPHVARGCGGRRCGCLGDLKLLFFDLVSHFMTLCNVMCHSSDIAVSTHLVLGGCPL